MAFMFSRRRLASGAVPVFATMFAAGEPGIWLDPSDLTTLFQDSAGTTPVTAAGQPVGKVLDKSGRGNHATQATAASRPTYQVDATGRAYLSFDGVDDFLVTPTITPGTNKVQVFAGVRKLTDAARGVLIEHSADINTNNGTFTIEAPDAAAATSYRTRSKGTAIATAPASGFVAPISNVVAMLNDISGDRTTLRVNGVQAAQAVTDQGTGNYLAYPIYIGRRGGTTLPFNGRIYSLAARFGPGLTASVISRAESQTAAKTGVAL